MPTNLVCDGAGRYAGIPLNELPHEYFDCLTGALCPPSSAQGGKKKNEKKEKRCTTQRSHGAARGVEGKKEDVGLQQHQIQILSFWQAFYYRHHSGRGRYWTRDFLNFLKKIDRAQAVESWRDE